MTQGAMGNVVPRQKPRMEQMDHQRGLSEQVRQRWSMMRHYVWSFYKARTQPGMFQNVQAYCLFVGHARSGGTMAGALLDAHPNASIADELDIFPYLKGGFSRNQLFHLILERSRRQTQRGRTKGGRDNQQYSYAVPGQWQGKYKNLLVVGNRKAGISTQHIHRDPGLLENLQLLLNGLPLHVIVSIRNPFDTISTSHLRTGRPIETGLDQYFKNCETIQWIRSVIPPDQFFILRHEELLEDPKGKLKDVCGFLNLNAPQDYLQACERVLYKSPSKSRYKVEWSPEMIHQVQRQIGDYDFLQGYSYDA